MGRNALVAALVVVAIAAGALWFSRHQRNYAVLELGTNPVVLRMVDGPFAGPDDCLARLVALAAPLRRTCPACAVTQHCMTALDRDLGAALANQPLAQPYVRAGNLREIITAPPPAGFQICRAIAASMQAQGHDAACVAPP